VKGEENLEHHTYDFVTFKGLERRAWGSCCNINIKVVNASLFIAFHIIYNLAYSPHAYDVHYMHVYFV
jgi:hypothetical protein